MFGLGAVGLAVIEAAKRAGARRWTTLTHSLSLVGAPALLLPRAPQQSFRPCSLTTGTQPWPPNRPTLRAGATTIFAIDINPDKFETARGWGATECINPKVGRLPAPAAMVGQLLFLHPRGLT